VQLRADLYACVCIGRALKPGGVACAQVHEHTCSIRTAYVSIRTAYINIGGITCAQAH
jgi:hypothetical protein